MILEFLRKLNTYNNDIINYRMRHNIECLMYFRVKSFDFSQTKLNFSQN